MRTYKIYYYYEHYDECHDFDIELQARNIDEALLMFNQSDTVFKRVWRIEELPFRPRQ